MDSKSLDILEFPKILDQLAGFAAFSASAGLIRALRPTNDYDLAVQRQARTSEARRLLSMHADVSIGGARDVRPQIELAGRGGILSTDELMDIKSTLLAARELGAVDGLGVDACEAFVEQARKRVGELADVR